MHIPPFDPPVLQPEKLNGLSLPAGLNVSMLRLDLLHPIISGNKWLKLQGWLQQAALYNRQGILTSGGPWSNHIHAAAAWAYLHQLPFGAIIKGKAAQLTPMLRDVQQWNGQITWVNHAEFKDEQHWQEMAEKANRQWIPLGGDGEAGQMGVAQYFNQFAAWQFDEIWCACGTGTTVAGMAASAMGAKKIVAFDPGIGDKKVYEKLASLAKLHPKRSIEIKGTTLGKFGKLGLEQVASMNTFYHQTGVGTDVVYTGKMIHAFMEELNLQTNCENKSVLLVHSGGLQGNRSAPAGTLKFMG